MTKESCDERHDVAIVTEIALIIAGLLNKSLISSDSCLPEVHPTTKKLSVVLQSSVA